MKKVNYNKLGNDEVLGSLQVGDVITNTPLGIEVQAITEGIFEISQDEEIVTITTMNGNLRTVQYIDRVSIDLLTTILLNKRIEKKLHQ